MEKNKDYSLIVDRIEDSVNNYVKNNATLNLQISRPDSTKIVCRISNGRATGVVNFYIKKNGLVSINIQGATIMQSVCEGCCDSVIQLTAIPNSLRKSFTIRQINEEGLELFKLELTDSLKLSISVKPASRNVNIKEAFDVIEESGVKVTCTVFNTGTFLLQGNVTPLYVNVMTVALQWLVDSSQLSSVPEYISFNNTSYVYPYDINQLVPNLSKCGDVDHIIERMILTSVSLFNSGVEVEDYGCYTFGVLKALEGVLKLRISEDLGSVEKLGDYYYYDEHSRCHHLDTKVFDGYIELKKALNEGYNIWVKSRHSSFHADEQIATSTLLSFEQAVGIFNDALSCINRVCNNWN